VSVDFPDSGNYTTFAHFLHPKIRKYINFRAAG